MEISKVITLLLDWRSGQTIENAVEEINSTYGVSITPIWRNAPFAYATIDTDEETLKRVCQCPFVYGVR